MNATFTPITGFEAADPSVTRITSGAKTWPTGTTCADPLTVSSLQAEAGVENIVNVWQGALFGDTHALT